MHIFLICCCYLLSERVGRYIYIKGVRSTCYNHFKPFIKRPAAAVTTLSAVVRYGGTPQCQKCPYLYPISNMAIKLRSFGPIVQSKYTLTQIRANKRSVWQVLLLLQFLIEYTTYDSGTTFHSNKYTRRFCV